MQLPQRFHDCKNTSVDLEHWGVVRMGFLCKKHQANKERAVWRVHGVLPAPPFVLPSSNTTSPSAAAGLNTKSNRIMKTMGQF